MKKLLVLFSVLLIVGCTVLRQTPPMQPAVNQAASSAFSLYFPMNVAATWEYSIKIEGKAEPLSFDQVFWPTVGNKGVIQSARGRFVEAMNNPNGEFKLKLQVKANVSQQGSLSYPNGVEIAVLEDTLGVYPSDLQGVFWVNNGSDSDFTVMELITFRKGSGRGTGFSEDGESMRLLGFAGAPNVSIGLGENPVDTLLYLGVDSSVVGYEGLLLLHYKRQVVASGESSELEKTFTEDVWFAEGKGMVRLEQRVEGIPSMTWILNSTLTQ